MVKPKDINWDKITLFYNKTNNMGSLYHNKKTLIIETPVLFCPYGLEIVSPDYLTLRILKEHKSNSHINLWKIIDKLSKILTKYVFKNQKRLLKTDDLDIEDVKDMFRGFSKEDKHIRFTLNLDLGRKTKIFDKNGKNIDSKLAGGLCSNPFYGRMALAIRGIWISPDHESFGLNINIDQIRINNIHELLDGMALVM